MRPRSWTFIIAALVAVWAAAAPISAQEIDRQRGTAVQRWPGGSGTADYDRGYRVGFRLGDNDARNGRRFDYERDRGYRNAGRNDRREGFRRGFAEGYRDGYQRARVVARGPAGRDVRQIRRPPRGYQEPAFARGYSDGYEKGLDDGRDRDRYDPVRHRDYRNGDDGYFRDYGSRDAYKNNYRAGFRQGYEDGYRDGFRRR